MKDMKIVLLGKPGTGKGTQGEMLSQKYKIPHISIGDVSREIASNLEHSLHQSIRDHFNQKTWKPLPDELTVQIAQSKLQDLDSWVVDGFPRNVHQAELFSIKPTHVIYFELSDELCIKRALDRNRKDDSLEKMNERLLIELGRIPQLLEFYSSKNLLHVINADQSPNKVLDEIIGICEIQKPKIDNETKIRFR